MFHLMAKLYRNTSGISGDVQHFNGRFCTGCFGQDSEAIARYLVREVKEYDKNEVEIFLQPKWLGLRQCDDPLDKKTLNEIKQLLRINDYKVR